MQLCLASLHPRVLSGQIDSLTGLGRALVRRGHDVTLVGPFDANSLLSRDPTELDSGPTHLLSAAGAMLRTVPRIVRASAGADLLHLALPTPAFGVLAEVVRKSTPVPVVVTFEGQLADAALIRNGLRRPSTLKGYLPLCAVNSGLLGRIGPRACRQYTVSSEFQRGQLVSVGFPLDRIRVLPNVVWDGKLTRCEPDVARARLGLPADRPIVGYVGHLSDVKGVDVLADAFCSMLKWEPRAVLALAWSGQGNPGPIRRRLAGVESQVVWLKKVHVGTFLCAVDVLALPYRTTAGQGAFPSLVLEALHVGCPLVTTDLPLLREVTSLGPVALVCPPEQPDELAKQLECLLTSQARRNRMSAAQRQVARSYFAPERLVSDYVALYEAVLGVDSMSVVA
ncbi:MAG TPA: glycosyltransferase family 4 protein [Chloroflexota bacterium]|nr:glycosyltransferase family 4 protein [Chloroflexota bacterium]